MKMTRMTIVLIAAIVLMGFTVRGQSVERSVIGTSGGTYFDGVNFEMDYTFGEMATFTLSNANNYLTQGFQQPFVDPGATITEPGNDGMVISYFPNPTPDNLTVSISNAPEQEISIELFDVLGQKITSNSAIAGFGGKFTLSVDMTNCAPGNYYLRIKGGEDFVKNFKILKIKN